MAKRDVSLHYISHTFWFPAKRVIDSSAGEWDGCLRGAESTKWVQCLNIPHTHTIIEIVLPHLYRELPSESREEICLQIKVFFSSLIHCNSHIVHTPVYWWPFIFHRSHKFNPWQVIAAHLTITDQRIYIWNLTNI